MMMPPMGGAPDPMAMGDPAMMMPPGEESIQMAPCAASDCANFQGGLCTILEAGTIVPMAGGGCQSFTPGMGGEQPPMPGGPATGAMPPSLDMLMGGGAPGQAPPLF